jgi:hypothetical protein
VLHGRTKDLVELSVRFGVLLQSCQKMSRIDSIESGSILNHHRENPFATSVYDGHPVKVNYAATR